MAPAARILLVDQDCAARKALAEVLRANGYSVDVIGGSFGALRRASDFHPDVVLVPESSEGLSLHAFLAEMRVRLPDCVVLVSAADPQGAIAMQLMQEGAADCLATPVCVRRLAIVLRRELERQGSRIEARALRARLETISIYAALAPSAPLVPGTSLEALEKFAILRTLEHTSGSTTRAARILGISARKIQYKLQEYKPV